MTTTLCARVGSSKTPDEKQTNINAEEAPRQPEAETNDAYLS